MNLHRYLIWALLCFITAIAYLSMNNRKADKGKREPFRKTLIVSIVIAIILPFIIMGIFRLLGIELIGKG